MASLDSKIIVTQSELRPCKVDGKNALFHTWEHYAQVLAPSLMVGGDNGGQVSMLLGIVEFEDGQVEKVYPQKIQFIDNIHRQYDFGSEE